MATDFIIKTSNPAALDATVQGLPMALAVVVDDSFDGETCRVRCLGDADFFRFAVRQQGYGEIVREEAV